MRAMDFDEDDFPATFFGSARELWDRIREALELPAPKNGDRRAAGTMPLGLTKRLEPDEGTKSQREYAWTKNEPGYRAAEALRKKKYNEAARLREARRRAEKRGKR
jgi:hypothetical protein